MTNHLHMGTCLSEGRRDKLKTVSFLKKNPYNSHLFIFYLSPFFQLNEIYLHMGTLSDLYDFLGLAYTHTIFLIQTNKSGQKLNLGTMGTT